MEGWDDRETSVVFFYLNTALFRTEGVKRWRRAFNFYSRLLSLLFYDWNLSSIFFHIIYDYFHLSPTFILFPLLLLSKDQLKPIFDGILSSSF